MERTKKVVGIMQPTYLPWIGYFELIARSDVFVFLDDVQFNGKSWQQRNRIKGANGEFWLTIPVLHKAKRYQNINEVNINNDLNWARVHLKSIEVCYSKSPYFEKYISDFRDLYGRPWERLVELNIAFIKMLMGAIGIETSVMLSSSMNILSKGNERVLEICNLLNARILYDTAGAVEFIDDTVFENGDVKVIYQEYMHPIYHQLHGEFVSHMSVIDLLFNEGPKCLDIILSGTNQKVKGEVV